MFSILFLNSIWKGLHLLSLFHFSLLLLFSFFCLSFLPVAIQLPSKLLFHSIQSHPIPFHPISSHPISFYSILSYSIPSYFIPFYSIPSHSSIHPIFPVDLFSFHSSHLILPSSLFYPPFLLLSCLQSMQLILLSTLTSWATLDSTCSYLSDLWRTFNGSLALEALSLSRFDFSITLICFVFSLIKSLLTSWVPVKRWSYVNTKACGAQDWRGGCRVDWGKKHG